MPVSEDICVQGCLTYPNACTLVPQCNRKITTQHLHFWILEAVLDEVIIMPWSCSVCYVSRGFRTATGIFGQQHCPLVMIIPWFLTASYSLGLFFLLSPPTPKKKWFPGAFCLSLLEMPLSWKCPHFHNYLFLVFLNRRH